VLANKVTWRLVGSIYILSNFLLLITLASPTIGVVYRGIRLTQRGVEAAGGDNPTVSQRVQLVTPTGGLDSEGLRLSARIPQTTDGQRVNGLMVDYRGHHKHLVSCIVNATPPGGQLTQQR